METIREQFAGKRELPPREYRSLRSAPLEDAPEVDLPIVGMIAETEVWAEFQVGVDETTWELIAAPGCMVEDSAVAGLRPGEFRPIPTPEPEYGPPDPSEWT